MDAAIRSPMSDIFVFPGSMALVAFGLHESPVPPTVPLGANSYTLKVPDGRLMPVNFISTTIETVLADLCQESRWVI